MYLHERQHHFLAALLRANANARVLPVHIIQEQLSRGNASDAIGRHQDDDRVIASSHWCFPRDGLKHLSQHRIIQTLGQGGMPITADRWNQPRKIGARRPPRCTVAEKSAQGSREAIGIGAFLEQTLYQALDDLGVQSLEPPAPSVQRVRAKS